MGWERIVGLSYRSSLISVRPFRSFSLPSFLSMKWGWRETEGMNEGERAKRKPKIKPSNPNHDTSTTTVSPPPSPPSSPSITMTPQPLSKSIDELRFPTAFSLFDPRIESKKLVSNRRIRRIQDEKPLSIDGWNRLNGWRDGWGREGGSDDVGGFFDRLFLFFRAGRDDGGST